MRVIVMGDVYYRPAYWQVDNKTRTITPGTVVVVVNDDPIELRLPGILRPYAFASTWVVYIIIIDGVVGLVRYDSFQRALDEFTIET